MTISRRALAGAALGAGLATLPTDPARAAVTSWTAFDAEQRAISARCSSFVARVGSTGQFRVIHQTNPEVLMPLASSAKLFVMLAVVQAVRSRRWSWSTILRLAAVDKAAGSGSLAPRPVGTPFTLQSAATHMIHESDNTAASMLIRYLGAPALAAAVRAAGHPAPTRLDPFSTFRQDMWLNWSRDTAAATARWQWASASAARKVQLVAPANLTSAHQPDMVGAVPGWPRGLGYFATAGTLARLHLLLHHAGLEAGLSPVRAIMANPDYLITKPSTWHYQQFKGGTAPGIKVGSWFAEGTRGTDVLVMMQASTGSVNLTRFNALATSAAGLLSRT